MKTTLRWSQTWPRWLRGHPWATLALLLPVAAWATWTVNAHFERPHQKPIVERVLEVDGGGTISTTLEQLYGLSSLIIEGQLVSELPHDSPVPGEKLMLVLTVCSFQVLEQLKPNSPSAHNQIDMLLGGGIRDRGSYIEKVTYPRFRFPEHGARYLLFLKREQGQDRYLTVSETGADASRIDDGQLTKLGDSPLARSIEKLSYTELKSRLSLMKGAR